MIKSWKWYKTETLVVQNLSDSHYLENNYRTYKVQYVYMNGKVYMLMIPTVILKLKDIPRSLAIT